jgi:hypothetical protein
MADPKLSLILAAKDFASREVNKLHGSLGKLHTGVGKVGGGFKTAGANVAKFGLIAGAGALVGIGALAAGILGAAKASADESTGIARLSGVAQGEHQGLEGQHDAIEADRCAGEARLQRRRPARVALEARRPLRQPLEGAERRDARDGLRRA